MRFLHGQLKAMSTFDFAQWRQRYVNWLRANKLRLTDFFRSSRSIANQDGTLGRNEFVNGMLSTSTSFYLAVITIKFFAASILLFKFQWLAMHFTLIICFLVCIHVKPNGVGITIGHHDLCVHVHDNVGRG